MFSQLASYMIDIISDKRVVFMIIMLREPVK